MQVTMSIFERLMGYLDIGLVHGAGRVDNEFCVQQAVSLATGGSKTDQPWCVNKPLRDLGISLNDQGLWSSNKSRSEGLRRFAVAEMGTDDRFDSVEFTRRLADRLDIVILEGSSHPLELYNRWFSGTEGGEERVTFFANLCADIMLEMETPGSQFLHYCDERYSKKEAKKIVKEETKKAYASGLCTFGGCGNKQTGAVAQ